METICHSGRSEPKDVALGGRSVGIETLLGRSKCGRFVKAPEFRRLKFCISLSRSLGRGWPTGMWSPPPASLRCQVLSSSKIKNTIQNVVLVHHVFHYIMGTNSPFCLRLCTTGRSVHRNSHSQGTPDVPGQVILLKQRLVHSTTLQQAKVI